MVTASRITDHGVMKVVFQTYRTGGSLGMHLEIHSRLLLAQVVRALRKHEAYVSCSGMHMT